MKKIIACIKPNPPLVYFVNQVHRAFPLHTVVVEDKSLGKRSFLDRMKARAAMGAEAPVRAHVPVRVRKKAMAARYTKILGRDWLDLDRSLPVVYCRNINDEVVETLLAKEKPDLLLDHGTSIVKECIFEKAMLALNLHWGLSPYYRGTHCTEWALINWDPYNIGVTVHRLAGKIDGGEVLCQSRVDIEPHDTVDSINMKLTREGTKILIEALKIWHAGLGLDFYPQDYSRGCLTLNRQWNRQLRKVVQGIEKNGLIAEMLKTPARRERLPIVRLRSCPEA